MKNILQFDENFDCVLLVNEANETNSIWFEVRTNDSADQELEIMIDGVTTTVSLTSDAMNKVQLENQYWNFGGTSSVRLVNADAQSEYVVLVFPEIITTEAALFQSAERQYSLQGQYNVEQAIDSVRNDMQGQINDVNERMLAFIPPHTVDRESISNGSTRDVLLFKFNCTQANPAVIFNSLLAYRVQTVVLSGSTYVDAMVTITFLLDDVQVSSMTQTFGDGQHLIMLNYKMENLTADNHVFKVRIGVDGGILS